MRLSRRSFLTGAVAATAGGILVAADVLSTKTIFLPPKGGWLPSDLTRVPQTRYSTISITTKKLLNPMDLIDVGGVMYRVTAVNYVPSGIGGSGLKKYALVPEHGMFLPVKEDRWNQPVVHEIKDTKPTPRGAESIPLSALEFGPRPDRFVEPVVERLDETAVEKILTYLHQPMTV